MEYARFLIKYPFLLGYLAFQVGSKAHTDLEERPFYGLWVEVTKRPNIHKPNVWAKLLSNKSSLTGNHPEPRRDSWRGLPTSGMRPVFGLVYRRFEVGKVGLGLLARMC